MKARNLVLFGAFSIAITVQSQVVTVLDDFSASNESNYNFLPVIGSPPDGWNVAGGVLSPNVPTGTEAWIWNQGQKLTTIGDKIYIEMNMLGGTAEMQMGFLLTPTINSTSGGHLLYLQ